MTKTKTKTSRILQTGGLLLGALLWSSLASSNMLVADGITWTLSMTGVGTNTGTITFTADVGNPGSTLGGAFLQNMQIKDVGGNNTDLFTVDNFATTNTAGGDWVVTNSELSAGGCGGGGATKGCADFTGAAGSRETDSVNFSATWGVTMTTGGLLSPTQHLKLRWLNQAGDKVGDLISQDLTVPVPAAAWLFGTGLIGLAGIARKRKAA